MTRQQAPHRGIRSAVRRLLRFAPLPGRWLGPNLEVAWLVLLALVIRAAAAWISPAVVNDSVSLLDAAGAVGRDGLHAVVGIPHHPLPPVAIALLAGVLGPEAGAVAMGVIAGAFAVWPLHVVARRLCGRHAATGACLLYAALPRAIEVAAVPLAEGLYIPLFLGAMALALTAGLARSRAAAALRLAGAGACGAAAYLCRPEGLVVAVSAAAGAALLARRGRRLGAAAVISVAFVLAAAPYVAALSKPAGHLRLSPKKDVVRFVGGGEPSSADVPRPAETRGAGLAEALRRTAGGLEGALTLPVLLLVALGAFPRRRWRRRRSIAPRALVLVTAAGLLALVVRLQTGWGYGGSRHSLTAALLLLPFAGEGLLFLGGFLPRVTSRRRFVWFCAAVLAVPMAIYALLRPAGESGVPARLLGERLAELPVGADTDRELLLATFAEPRVAYYAGRALGPGARHARDVRLWGRHRELTLPAYVILDNRRAALAEHLRTVGADYLVLDLFHVDVHDGVEYVPGRELADRLQRDGLIATRAAVSGGDLAAFPVLAK